MGLQGGFGPAIERVRQAGLPATREHILVAKLVLDRPLLPPVDDLLDEVYEEGLGLSHDTLVTMIARFRSVGLLKDDGHAGREPPATAAPAAADAHAAATLLKAIANPWRYAVLCLLRQGERSVGALERELDIGQSALSQHLSRLRELNLVRTRRQAQRILYSLASPAVADLIDALCQGCRYVLGARR